MAIPESALADEPTSRDKARRASLIARSCAVFGVETIYIYSVRGARRSDASLLSAMLRYAETPQYLRRRLFSRLGELKYAGLMQPLQIPSHAVAPAARDVREGDVREAVAVRTRRGTLADIGVGALVRCAGSPAPNRRITVRVRSVRPEISVAEIPRSEAGAYWGYEVRQRASLADLLRTWSGRVILTSRLGRAGGAGARGRTLVAFGTAERGLGDLLGGGIARLPHARMINYFPSQQTRTVRLEEAILGVLAIIRSGERAGGAPR